MASSTTICATTAQNFAPLRWVGLSLSFPSSRSLSSTVALNSRNKPPNSMIKSRALKLKSRKAINGLVRVTSQEIEASSRRRMTIASIRPVIRARSRWAGGSFSARIAIKTRLSMPNTSSITTSVTRPAQIDGSAIHSICIKTCTTAVCVTTIMDKMSLKCNNDADIALPWMDIFPAHKANR